MGNAKKSHTIIQMEDIKELDVVRVKAILLDSAERGNIAPEEIRKEPSIGETGIVVHKYQCKPKEKQRYVVERCINNGKPIWLADFIIDELEKVN